MKINFIKPFATFILPAFILLSVISCNVEKTTTMSYSPDEVMAAAEKVDSLFLVAFNSGNVDAIMDLHWNSPELVAYPPAGDMKMNGYEAVKASYIKEFTINKGASLAYTETKNIPFEDGVAGYGTFTWTMPVEGQAPMVFEGRYSDIKLFKDGKMVIVHDHTSMPMPEEPPASDTTTVQ